MFGTSLSQSSASSTACVRAISCKHPGFAASRHAQVLQVPAEDLRRASVGSPQQTAEAIELRLVAPPGSERQGGFQPRQNRRGHTSNHDAGMYFAGYQAGEPGALLPHIDQFLAMLAINQSNPPVAQSQSPGALAA
jgi:hypothetical protein